MIHGGTDIAQIGDCWVIRRCSACQQEPKSAYLFWTGNRWRYNLDVAMRFSTSEAALSYAAKSARRMAVKSAFGAEELRKISAAENDSEKEQKLI